MPDALFFEFTGVSVHDYRAVNAILGLDPVTGDGLWPVGLLSHTGAAGSDGVFVVSRCGSRRKPRQPGWLRGWVRRSARPGYRSRNGSGG
jgi:hypothetical protein